MKPREALEMSAKAGRMKAAERRDQILEAAMKVFAEETYHGATTAKIATAAEISEPVIYMHFKNKKELFLEVLRRFREFIVEWNARALAEHEEPLARYRAFVDMYHQFATDVSQDSKNIWVSAAAMKDPDIQAEISRYYDAVTEQLTNDIRKSMEQEKISSRYPPEVLARMIHGVSAEIGWSILMGKSKGRDWVYESIKDLLEDLFRKD